MTKTRTTLAGLLATTLALSCVSYAEATGYPYEQTVCWAMDNPTLDNANTYQWPQHKVDCGVVPAANDTTCGTPGKYQVDTYWIRDDTDRDYLAGMTVMSSPADDAQLEPHGYYAVTVTAKPAEQCVAPTPSPTPTPTVTPTTEPTPEPTPPTITTPPAATPSVTPQPTTPAHTMPPDVQTSKPPTVDVAATRAETHCLGNALITTTQKYVDGEWQQTSSSTINGATRCATKPNEPAVKEEGL